MADDQRIKYEDLPDRYHEDAIAGVTAHLAELPATALDLARLEAEMQALIMRNYHNAVENSYSNSMHYSLPRETTIRETPKVAYWALAISLIAAIMATLALIF